MEKVTPGQPAGATPTRHYLVLFLGFTGASSVGLWMGQLRRLQPLISIVLVLFSVTLVWVNSCITAKRIPVDMGWLDHPMLAVAEIAVELFFLWLPMAKINPPPRSAPVDRTPQSAIPAPAEAQGDQTVAQR